MDGSAPLPCDRVHLILFMLDALAKLSSLDHRGNCRFRDHPERVPVVRVGYQHLGRHVGAASSHGIHRVGANRQAFAVAVRLVRRGASIEQSSA